MVRLQCGLGKEKLPRRAQFELTSLSSLYRAHQATRVGNMSIDSKIPFRCIYVFFLVPQGASRSRVAQKLDAH